MKKSNKNNMKTMANAAGPHIVLTDLITMTFDLKGVRTQVAALPARFSANACDSGDRTC